MDSGGRQHEEPRRVSKKTKIDRLRNLPDYLFDDIISCLSTKDLFRYSLASNKCRELILHMPSLTLDENELGFRRLSETHKHQLLGFIDKLLAQRYATEDASIHTFSLSWTDTKFCWYVNRFLFHVMNSGVQCLKVGGSRGIPLLLHKFDFPSINLDLCNCSTIRELCFSSVSTSGVDIGELVSRSCTSIKRLELDCVHGSTIIFIKSSSLQYFRFRCNHRNELRHLSVTGKHSLKAIEINWYFASPKNTILMINAPNLEEIRWRGYFLENYCILYAWKLAHLKVAYLCLNWIPNNHSHPTRKAALDILQDVGEAKVLGLCAHHIQALIHLGCIHSLPWSLRNLQQLLLYTLISDDNTENMASLLSAFPNLKRLHVQYAYERQVIHSLPSRKPTFDADYWKSRKLSFVEQMKEACIHIYTGENDLELAKYLLMHCKKLERMEILYSPPLLDAIRVQIMKCVNAHNTHLCFTEINSHPSLDWPSIFDGTIPKD